jgi:hypothetical protein
MAIICVPPCFFKKPAHCTEPSIFLAGSIEMGAATDWQSQAIVALDDVASVIYNPRRPDWDSSWTQEIDSPQFNIQVNWELENIENVDLIIMNFEPNTASAITLLELGFIAARSPDKLHVVCPEGFWRKRNVDIVCKRYGVKMYETLEDMLIMVKTNL